MKTNDQDLPPLWQFVPMAQHEKPPEPAAEKVRRGLRGIWDRLGIGTGKSHDPIGQEALQAVGGEDLDRIVAPPPWRDGIGPLDEALKDWVDSTGNGCPLMVVVAPPHSGVRQIVEGWAAMKEWPLLNPPDPRSLLGQTGGLLRDAHAHMETPLVLSRLEHWYLRHHNGLRLLRELLDHLSLRRRHTLLCCDSWAWAYLSRTVHPQLVLPAPLVPAAFHESHLRRWFRSLVQGADGRRCVLRHPETGKLVLDTGELQSENTGPEHSDFLKRVAAHSRGIPGVAHALWRHCLRFSVEKLEENPEARDENTPCPRTVWVEPWRELELPRVPEGDRNRFAFLLHALLLHNGLSSYLLADILQCLSHPQAEGLQELRGAGIVVEEQGVWRVSALGYPAARRFLESEEYLVDAF